jgi:Xaa-Pro aminopeptidase
MASSLPSSLCDDLKTGRALGLTQRTGLFTLPGVFRMDLEASGRACIMQAAADSQWKGYTLAERDRRWNAVRQNAAQAGLDCVFLPQCLDGRNIKLSLEQARGTRSDSRYLTQFENAAIVIPTDGREPIAVNMNGEWNDWLPNARAAGKNAEMRASWAPAMAEALSELGMERARIGVVGLSRGKVTHGRAQNGVVNHTAYQGVKDRLPNATYVDATDVVGFARYIKSDEEIANLRTGAGMAIEGIKEMARVARPGVPESVVYAKVMGKILSFGSEYYPMAINCGPVDGWTYRHEDPHLGLVLGENWIIENEVDAVWGQMVAQEMQPMFLGPIPEKQKPVIEVQRELYYAGLAYMTPGREFGDMIDYVNNYGSKHGMKSSILMHGRGYGDDGPLLTPRDLGENSRDVRVEKNNVWVWKPTVISGDGQESFSWGGCVMVTDKGGVQLVEREPELISIQ